jgi:AcrR family transcriptional regulator
MLAPQQKRSQASVERVFAATRALLEEKGFDGVTVQEVSARAEVSVGAIYGRFQSKENLLRAVQRDWIERGRQAAGEAPEIGGAATAAEAIATAVDDLARVFRGGERLMGAFMHLGAVDAEIADRGSRASIELCHQFSAAVLAHRGAIVRADPEQAVDVAFRMAYSAFARLVMYGPTFESDRPIGWDELVAEVATACTAYLLR